MIIGIIGSGGREHAICVKILESKKVDRVYCFPGNAGTDLIATNIEIKVDEFEKIKDFVINNKIDFLIVGPEKPLVEGIVNYLGQKSLHLNLKDQKYLQKNFAKNIIYLPQSLEFFKKLKKLTYF